MSDADRCGPERLRRMYRGAVRPDDESPPPPDQCHPVVRPELARHVQIWTPRGRDAVKLVCTEPEVTHLLLHRVDGRSEACVGFTRYCYPCRIKLPVRWMGYVGGFISHTRVPVVLSITPGAMRQLESGQGAAGSLFRRWLTTARGGDTPRARQWLSLGPRSDAVVLPYETTATPVLCRRYNLPGAELELLHQAARRYWIDRGREVCEDDGSC